MTRTLALIAAAGLASIANAQSITPIFVTGDVLPDSDGQTFKFAYDSSISHDGYVAFKVRTQVEPESAANQGLYFGQLDSISKVAFEGELAPGTSYNYETFNGFDKTGPIRISGQNGYLSYAAQLEIPGQGDPNNVGLWSNRPGAIEKGGLIGDTAPGGTDTFGAFERQWFDNSGRSAFFAITTWGSGIFTDPTGSGVYERTAFSGDAIPGLNPGETLNNFSFPHANSNGQWLVLASLNGSSDKVLIAGDHNTGEVAAVLREGTPISNSTQTVDSFTDIGNNQLINANRTIAFGMFGSAFLGGIVVASEETGVRVVGERHQPIGDTGLTFNSNLTALPKLNNNDEVSFVARINGAPSSSDRAIIVTDSDLTPSILIREGDQAPGTPKGVRFGSPPNNSSQPDHIFNDNGIVVAGMPLSGAASGSNYGIFFGTSAEDLALLLRTGDSFDVGGDEKTISSISYTDDIGPDGLPLALNNSNQFIFELGFTDGTYGIFVASLVSCSGDVTNDGAVDLADLNLVLANFGQTTASGDTDGNGVVDLADLNLVLANFGAACN